MNEKPWGNLFAYNMFLRPSEEELEKYKPEWHVIAVPGLKLDAKECGIRQHNAAVISFSCFFNSLFSRSNASILLTASSSLANFAHLLLDTAAGLAAL